MFLFVEHFDETRKQSQNFVLQIVQKFFVFKTRMKLSQDWHQIAPVTLPVSREVHKLILVIPVENYAQFPFKLCRHYRIYTPLVIFYSPLAHYLGQDAEWHDRFCRHKTPILF